MQLGGAALLLCAAGLAAAPAPAPGAGPERRAAAGAGRERRVQFASWDEVNVLAHGLLQLGHGLKEHVERTKGQLRELGGRLSAHNSSLGRLCSTSPRRCGSGWRSDGAHLALPPQSLMDAQNLRIEELLQKIKQQQYKLDKQNLQIKSLQSKVRSCLWAEPVLAGRWPGQWQPPVTVSLPTEGGWTVIQRRMDGSVDFDQLWDAYKNGFGDLHGDFWLGLEKIHHLVQEGKYNLLIELEDWEGNSQVVQFVFSLGGESTAYTLNLLGPLSGELENAIGEFRQLPFSTRDRDHDLKADTNCAKHLSGGWWFSTCGHANLNGKYFRSIPRQRHERKQGIFWKTWKGRYYPLKSTIMKIQPAALEAEP
uniref:Fibrinogen C-terminal domain-containing protein n=1 Tax=Geospiza parvula TaxID=87175 RepID=A0A8U8CLQ6_GEOPR